MDLSLNVGEMAVDYTEVARKEHLSELEVEIRKLNDKLRDIMKEVHYQRGREEEFRETSESTSSRVQWWSIAQVLWFHCIALSHLSKKLTSNLELLSADDHSDRVRHLADSASAAVFHRQEAQVAGVRVDGSKTSSIKNSEYCGLLFFRCCVGHHRWCYACQLDVVGATQAVIIIKVPLVCS